MAPSLPLSPVFIPSLLAVSYLSTLSLLLPSSVASKLALHLGWSVSADLSISSPLPLNAASAPSITLFTPILSSPTFSTGKGFSLGFFSLFDSTSAQPPTRIFFAICLGTNVTDSEGKSFAIPVWKWDPRRPLKQVGETGLASLSVSNSRDNVYADQGVDLVLKDGDGSEVWRWQRVVAMEMQEDGNWVLYNSSDQIAWQSFNHPSDTLLQGQQLALGMKLVSENALFALEMKRGGLVFHMRSEAYTTLYYWAIPINTSLLWYLAQHGFDLSGNPPFNITAFIDTYVCARETSGFIEPYAVLLGQNLTVQGGCASSQWTEYSNSLLNKTYSSDFLKIVDNGEAEGYTYLHRNGDNLLFSDISGSVNCLAPNSCGAYGICSAPDPFGSQHTCHCPSVEDNEELSHVFNPINPADPSQGCVRTEPLQCNSLLNNTLVEIKLSTLSIIRVLYETTYAQNRYPLEECLALCTSNCSCTGLFFHHGTSYCLPFRDTDGFSNISFFSASSLQDFSTYVKVPPSVVSSSGGLPPPVKHPDRMNHRVVYAISAGSLVIIVCSILLCVKRYRRHAKNIKMDADVSEEELQSVLPMLSVRYSCKELHEATEGFKKQVGSGAFGCVFEGMLPDGRKIAVKRLEQISISSKQFLAEVTTLGGVSHYNVVRLYGFCLQKSSRLLVYEFVENGSLDRWLFSEDEDRLLSWTMRYDVALGIARGLAYLHSECPQPIIHFDVKPQNILLDQNFVPKLCDFGLSKLVARESSFVMTGIRGTPGYLAPEWLSYSVVSKKCDVYSFGMVLFELVGGRKNILLSLMESDEWYLPTWAALKCKQGKMMELVDKRLEGAFDAEQVKIIVHVAFLCIQKDPNLRPSTSSVCKILEGVVPLDCEVPYNSGLEPLSQETHNSLVNCSR